MVKDFDDAYVSGSKEFTIDYKGQPKKFFADEIGFLGMQHIAMQTVRSGLNGASLLISSCIRTESGDRFTYDEAQRLRQDIAEIFMKHANEVNHFGQKK